MQVQHPIVWKMLRINPFLFKIILCGIFLPTTVCGEPGLLSPPARNWGFTSLFGTFDRAALQRGFQVYKEVCSACHGLKRVSYRNLSALGFNQNEIKAIAAEADVTDGPNDEGQMFQRKGLPADSFVGPYANDKAARAANNGALPPDQSLIVKARSGGADYIYALLTGYTSPPFGVTVEEGRHYNPYFPGGLISMAPPLTEGQVSYADGTKASVEQMAQDVVEFLSWAAEPELEQRKQMGVKVLLYLTFMVIIFYLTYRKIWRDVK